MVKGSGLMCCQLACEIWGLRAYRFKGFPLVLGSMRAQYAIFKLTQGQRNHESLNPKP